MVSLWYRKELKKDYRDEYEINRFLYEIQLTGNLKLNDLYLNVA